MTFIERDYNLVITHGNGPQVGQLMRQTDLTRDEIPAMPLDVLVADTEGWLGYRSTDFSSTITSASYPRAIVTH